MTRRWTHDVSKDWLAARRTVLTATDIKSLVPEYKRLKKKPLKAGEISPAFAAVWAEKTSSMELDTSSPSYAAARGHVMEPYAVKSWNEEIATGQGMYHWDDCIIVRNGVGFSPDAMNRAQPGSAPLLMVHPDGSSLIDGGSTIMPSPTEILEVKSYEPRAHMKAVLIDDADKTSRDEAMQVATAFYVLPELENANLLFFCPAAKLSMHAVMYSRKDVKPLVEIVNEIAAMYYRTAEQLSAMADDPTRFKSAFTEDEIWKEFVEMQATEDGFMLK